MWPQSTDDSIQTFRTQCELLVYVLTCGISFESTPVTANTNNMISTIEYKDEKQKEGGSEYLLEGHDQWVTSSHTVVHHSPVTAISEADTLHRKG